jgi:hypothetical protein
VVLRDEMKLQDNTKERLRDELGRLRRRVSELEVLEIERRRTHEALKESKNRARALLNAPTEMEVRHYSTFGNHVRLRIVFGYTS